MKKNRLTVQYLQEWWLKKYFNKTVQDVIKEHPEDVHSPEWFKHYQVTQEQYDEWEDWAINAIAKDKNLGYNYVKNNWGFVSLDAAPMIKEKKP